ncbi:jg1967 [Pararge aegeria aegeria]|uniref:Jg1967 protein n=1 Tax=Pararge aegeria aegeria TaxID=348720 RepID=A0A8S4R137_9NEOP|nr:jg1967 [Pararge aegeria aegeria]
MFLLITITITSSSSSKAYKRPLLNIGARAKSAPPHTVFRLSRLAADDPKKVARSGWIRKQLITHLLVFHTKHQLRFTHRGFQRSILKISKIHKVRSDIIRQRTKVLVVVTDAQKQALKLKWQLAGQISRYADKRWTIQTTRGKGSEGKVDVGKPSKRWADDIKRTAGNEWMNQGKERENWKKVDGGFYPRRRKYFL